MSVNTEPSSAFQTAALHRPRSVPGTRRQAMTGNSGIAVVVVTVLVGIVAVAGLLLLDLGAPAPGDPDSVATPPVITTPSATAPAPAAAPTSAPQQGASIADLVTPLAQRLEAAPDNPSDWVLLGKSYDYLGRPELAAHAYRQAIRYGNSDPAVVAALNQAETAASLPAVAGSPSAQPPAARLPATPLPAASIDSWLNAEPTDENGAAPELYGVSGRIALAPEFADVVQAHHTVFVTAQATDGPAMPLAVLRTTAANWPLVYRLDDSMAMMPGHTLTSARQFVVLARVSASGNATRQPGDLLGRSPAIHAGFRGPVNFTIDQVVKK